MIRFWKEEEVEACQKWWNIKYMWLLHWLSQLTCVTESIQRFPHNIYSWPQMEQGPYCISVYSEILFTRIVWNCYAKIFWLQGYLCCKIVACNSTYGSPSPLGIFIPYISQSSGATMLSAPFSEGIYMPLSRVFIVVHCVIADVFSQTCVYGFVQAPFNICWKINEYLGKSICLREYELGSGFKEICQKLYKL